MSYTEHHKINEDFLKQFPLEGLKDMTLEQYTNLNRSDSFCYWIESKTEILGSVWGGSAYKFGIYQYDQKPKDGMTNRQYDDKYAWYSSLGSSSGEAFARVKEAVIKAAECGNKGDLKAIESIKALSSIIKWKIAFLYSNESIIPYYSLDRLRVIGEKMGMKDAKTSPIAAIQEFLINERNGLDIHEYGKKLDDIWKESDASATSHIRKVWMWKGDINTFKQEKLTAGDSVSDKIQDFESYPDYQTMRDDVQKAINNTDVSVPDAYWKFMKDVHIGDIVVVFKNKQIGNSNHHIMYGWGVFTSEFINDKNCKHPLQRSVEWKYILDKPIASGVVKNKLFFHKTTETQAKEIIKLLNIDESLLIESPIVTDMKYKQIIEIIKENYNLVLTGAPGTGKTYMAKAIAEEMEAEWEFVQFHPSYDYTDFVEGLRPTGDSGNFGFELRNGIFKEFCAKALQNLIDSKKSLQALQQENSVRDILDEFLEDAIEFGKTFKTAGTKNVFHVAENKERTVIVEVPANQKTSLVKLPKSELLTLLENKVEIFGGKDIQEYFKRKHRTQQDSYVYVLYNHVMKYEPKKKPVDVSLVKRKNYVFIIDEINRGEISKIFGELFFSIDPGYRGGRGRVKTQYQNMLEDDDIFKDGFFVPENVYIIGTMNDIDRSVESMDFAMRRRFTWKEVTPADTEAMLDTLPCSSEAKATMARLNKAISETDGLGAAYQIGPSYFLKLGKNGGDFNKLWEMSLEPLLKEYLRGFRKTSEILDKFSKAYFGTKEEQTTDSTELIDED